MLSPLQLELTKLIGRKELTQGVILENEWAGDNNPSRFFVFTHKDNGHHNGYFEYNGKIRNCSIIDDKESKTNVIGHPATLSDFHRWMNENFGDTGEWKQKPEFILSMEQWDMKGKKIKDEVYIQYNSSKDLLEQDTETLKQIIELIRNNQ